MQVSLGLVLGLGLGMVLAQDVIPASTSARVVSLLEPIGTAWINAVRMTVIPLVVPLLIVGVAGSEDTRYTGSVGARAFGWFLRGILRARVTMAVSVSHARSRRDDTTA